MNIIPSFYSNEIIELIRRDMKNALEEMQRSIDWYDFKIITLYKKYHTLIDGDFISRKWWFILRKI